jgi:hypothetical protein
VPVILTSARKRAESPGCASICRLKFSERSLTQMKSADDSEMPSPHNLGSGQECL